MNLKQIPFIEELYTTRVEMAGNIEGVNRKSLLLAERYRKKLIENITDKKLQKELIKNFNFYEKRVEKELEIISIADYAKGLDDAKILRKELDFLSKSKIFKPREEIFEDIYNMALEKVGQLTEEDRKFLDEKLKKIDFSDILDTLDEEKKKEFNTMIEERFNNVYDEMGHFCQKYWENGYDFCRSLIFMCM